MINIEEIKLKWAKAWSLAEKGPFSVPLIICLYAVIIYVYMYIYKKEM